MLSICPSADPDAETEIMGSWMTPKNTDTRRRTISKQHASSSKVGSAADLSGNKLGTFCYKNHMQNVFHTC